MNQILNKKEDKNKEELTKYVENKDSIYSELNGSIGANRRLEDIYNFLKSNINYNISKNNQSKDWPKFIKETIQHNKKMDMKNESNNKRTEEKKNKLLYLIFMFQKVMN